MMKIKVPDIPDELAGALSLRWLTEVDDNISAGQQIFRLENDKLTLEVSAPVAGILIEKHFATGAQVGPGDTVCDLEPMRLRDTSSPATIIEEDTGSSAGLEHREITPAAPFVDRDGERAIREALGEAIQLIIRTNMQQFVAPENMQHLYHGESWTHNVDTANDEPGRLMEAKVQLEVKYQDVADNDFNILPKYIQEIAEGMTSQAVAQLLAVVEKSTERSGNNVSVKEEGSFKAAFLRMLEKIEFSVGRDGQVQRPEMHLSPQMYEKVLPELQEADELFRQQVEAISHEKEQQALQAEAERLAKYKSVQAS